MKTIITGEGNGKIGFFIENTNQLSGRQKFFLKFAAFLADNSPNEVFFISKVFEQDIKPYSASKLKIYDISEFDFSSMEGGAWIVPANYLLHLLIRVRLLNSARIFLYVYDRGCIDRLLKQNVKGENNDSLITLLKSKGACFFSDGNVFNYNHDKYGFSEEQYLPLGIDDENNYIAPSILNSRDINIGYLNGFAERDIKVICSLMKNLQKSENRKINLHILGNGNGFIKIPLHKFSPQTRIVYVGDLDDIATGEYLRTEVDFVVAYNEVALKVANFSVPVVIPMLSEKKGDNDSFLWLSDIRKFVYERDNEKESGGKTIGQIIDQILTNDNKSSIAKLCFTFVDNHAKIKRIAEAFLDMLSKQTGILLPQALDNKFINAQLEEYLLYKQSTKSVSSYNDFLKEKNTKQCTKREKRSKSLRLKEWLLSNVFNKALYADYYDVNNSYKKKIARIKKKIPKQGNIKVGFIVVFNSVFQYRPIFERMIEDSNFDPFIIIAPNVSRTHKYMVETYEEAYVSLKEQYGKRVLNGYDMEEGEFIRLRNEFSILFFCNPYKHLVHPYHHVEYFLDKDVLPIYSSYGFAALKFWDEVIATPFYNYMWKCTLETESNLEHLKKTEKIRGKNGVVTGYLKMDKLAELKPVPHVRKRIMICPHHTVWGWKNLNIGNFLSYAEYFQRLPEMFPDVDFIFRPHPLLFANLKLHKVWTQAQIDEYMARLLAHPNMVYDTSGDYMQVFADSDAMIHDCGSFIGEYLYTMKPCCYMLKSEDAVKTTLVPLGQKCMEQYYHAFCEEDITRFIKEVVIDGNDPMKEQRERFAKNELMVNFPHAADSVINMIKKELGIKE